MPAADGLITMKFHVFGEKPPAPTGGGGGHVPMSYRVSTQTRGRAVQMRNAPMPSSRSVAMPSTALPARTGAPLRIIRVKASFGDKDISKEYVADKKIVVKVKVNQLFTQLRETIKVIAEGLFSDVNTKE